MQAPNHLWIECIGLPGSGKSTIAVQLVDRLCRSGLNATLFPEAIRLALAASVRGSIAESTPKRWLARFALQRPLYRMWCRRAYPSQMTHAYVDFTLRHPIYYATIQKLFTGKMRENPDSNRLYRFIFEECAGYELVRQNLPGSSPVVMDEGFAMRAATFWGRSTLDQALRAEDETAIAKYIQSTPTPDGVIYCQTSIETCIARMQKRGFAPLVGHRDPARVEWKMKRTEEILQIVLKQMRRQHIPVFTIDAEERETIDKALSQLLESQVAPFS